MIHFRTLGSAAIKTISLDQFESGCESGRWILDIDHAQPGDAHAAFVPYTKEANKALIDKSLAGIPGLPDVAKAVLAMYPDSTECVPAGNDPEPPPEVDSGLPDSSPGDVDPTSPEMLQDAAAAESIEALQHDLQAEIPLAADGPPDGPPDGSEPVRSKGGGRSLTDPLRGGGCLALAAGPFSSAPLHATDGRRPSGPVPE